MYDQLNALLDGMLEQIKADYPKYSEAQAALGALHVSIYALVENLSHTVEQGKGLTDMELFNLVGAFITKSNWIAAKLLSMDLDPDDA